MSTPESQLKLTAEVRDMYERCQALRSSVAAVNVAQHQFILDLDMFILATGLAEEVGLSVRSWTKWIKAWDAKLTRAEVFVEGKQIEYGVTNEPKPKPVTVVEVVAEPEPEESKNEPN